ncbi:MAG TPA: DNA polymerase IV [Lentisphaeria bacterium]|nr:MAG: DNA polymerase IV [Lentisphaerae bacterium GWF2_50_93]HCE44074.1 DNA polymerase IV [Lentisphaeria bacterium]
MLVRKIIHVDMDAFYASIEQRDNPKLRGEPVIVGGLPGSRGVVCTASYEARKFGVHSAMPINMATKLCPHGIFLPVRMEAYCAESEHIRNVFLDYTDLVEPLSLDEAYLDVTHNKKKIPSATWIAKEIQKRIFSETRLTASAGVSFNMFLAKIASGLHKPSGLTVITPKEADAFIDSLPIDDFWGIGKVTAEKFRGLGIEKGSDLKKMSLPDLVLAFGKSGIYYYNIVRGIDDRMVTPDQPRKSMGREVTLERDTDSISEIHELLRELSAEVEKMLREEKLLGKTVTLKLKYDDFTQITRQQSAGENIDSSKIIYEIASGLLKKTEAGVRKARLVGVSVSGFPPPPDDKGPVQLTFPF